MVYQPAAGLRSRKVDMKKHLPVYHLSELPDLDEVSASLPTAQTTVSTGVEKEEEAEHHLQAALNAAQTDINKSNYIPIPDASFLIPNYDELSCADYELPKTYIRCSTPVDEFMGCPYNMDDRDVLWLADIQKSEKFTKDAKLDEDHFEMIMWNLERLANEKLDGSCPAIDEFPAFLEVEQPSLLPSSPLFPIVYDYWKVRRFVDRGGKPITPQLKTEELLEENDPYICFRKRELKAMRKTRRYDNHSVDRIQKLGADLNRARELLSLVTERERLRKESTLAELELFEGRIRVRKMKKLLGILTTANDIDASPEKSKRRRKPDDARGGPTKIKIPFQRYRDAVQYGDNMDSPESLTVEDRIKRRRFLDEKEGWLDFTESPFISNYPTPPNENAAFNLIIPENSTNRRHTSSCRGRRRLGRGGRILIDRRVDCKDILENVKKSYERKLAEKKDDDPFDEDLENMANFIDRWKYDTSIVDIDEGCVIELEESPDFTLYRALNLTPANEPECRTLMNKPYYPEQVTILPRTHQQRMFIIQQQQQLNQPQIIRPQTSSPNANKRKNRPSDGTKASAVKKKVEPPLEARDFAVRAMLQQSQKAAQATQQSQQLIAGQSRTDANGNIIQGSPTNSSLGMNSLSPQGFPQNLQQQLNPQHIRMLQQMRFQQAQQQLAAAGVAPGSPSHQAAMMQQLNLTPQQLQHWFLQQQMMRQQQEQMRFMGQQQQAGSTNGSVDESSMLVDEDGK